MTHWHSCPSSHSPPSAGASESIQWIWHPLGACICGRVFSVPQAFSCHKRSCPMSKKRLSGVLERAKEVWQARKRRKAEVDQSKSSEDSSNQLENDSDTSCPSSSHVDVLNYTCIHPQVCRLSSYRQHRLLIRSCSECRYLRCKL